MENRPSSREIERERLIQAIATIEARRSILGDHVTETAIMTLQEKLASLEAPRVAEQRKLVTILFADVSGFTAMSEALDPEDVRDLMNALWARLDSIIISYGGIVDKHMGDAVMAIFGAPTAREDDPERAIRAALAMQQTLSTWETDFASDFPISIRIGIHTGPVWLGTVGVTAEYTAMGDTVNLASRLQHAAPVGGVIVSHETYRHVRGVFDVLPMEPITIKGKTEPIPVYVILRPRPYAFRLSSRGIGGIETHMVGRDRELGQLQDTLRMVISQKQAHMITISGEAGVGKSRLLYEFNDWVALLAEQVIFFRGRASEQMSAVPYFLIRTMFSYYLGIQDSDSAATVREKFEQKISEVLSSNTSDDPENPDSPDGVEKAHFIGHLLGFDFSTSPYLRGILEDSRQIRDRAFYYIAQFFGTVAQRHPAIIILEDVHWADDSSLDLIDYLARECQQSLLLIICLARPSLFERRPTWGERQPAHTHIELHPLSGEESRQLVKEILRKAPDIPSELLDLIIKRTEGNPFYIEEFVRVLIEDDVIVPGIDHWRIESERLTRVRIPPTLVGVLQARLDRLSPLEREVLQCASVVGRVFWKGAVTHIYHPPESNVAQDETDEIHTTLQRLCEKELIYRREGSDTTFAGEEEYAFKHTILHEATYESVLKRLRKLYHAQVASWLIAQSGERVGEYAGLIGSHYERAGKSIQAAGWYGQAAKQARNTYAPEAAITYYRKALAALPEQPEQTSESNIWLSRTTQRIILYEGLAEMLLWQARYAEAAEACQEMQMAAQAGQDSVAYARSWNILARIQDAQGNYVACLESATRAEEIAREADPLGQVELARALCQKGWTCYRLGDIEATLQNGEQALQLSTQLNLQREKADSLSLLGCVHSMLGHYGDAAHYNTSAVELYQELGDRERIGVMLARLGDHAQMRGDYPAAVALYQEALKTAYETGNRNHEMVFLTNLSGARVGVGDYRVAEYDLRRIIRWAEINGQIGWLSEAYCFLAEACLGQNKAAEALPAARRALEVGQKIASPFLVATAWRTLGRAMAQVEPPEPTKDNEIRTCFTKSLEIFTEIGAEREYARTLEALAEYELNQGHTAESQTLREQAQEIFEQLEQTPE